MEHDLCTAGLSQTRCLRQVRITEWAIIWVMLSCDDYAAASSSKSMSMSSCRFFAADATGSSWWTLLIDSRARLLARATLGAVIASGRPVCDSEPRKRQNSSRWKLLRNGLDRNAYKIGLTQLFMYDKQLAATLIAMMLGESTWRHCSAKKTTYQYSMSSLFLPERDYYVTFGYLLSQIRLSSVCL